MTLREKAAFCSGRGYWYTKAVRRLGLESVMLADGPHGLRRQGVIGNALGIGGSAPATCFPTASLTACSFDRDLLREIGEAIAEEAADQGVSVVLGPGVNIKRGPLCGRNFEYFSEDPFVSGELGAAFVRGVQGAGIGACVKHFAANNQEKNRMVSDSVVDERALREIYLPAFEKVIKTANPAAVMCSYNKLNGAYASENKRLLTDILRNEWGYEGAVVSDWGATADRVAGLKAGLDLEMPGFGGYNTRKVIRAVKSGELPEATLDRAVERVVALALRYRGEHKRTVPFVLSSPCVPYDRHHSLARRAAAESAVLLRNEGGVLPLAPGARIAVAGEFARRPRYQGAGSSEVNPTRIDRAWDELLRDFPDAVFAPGYALDGHSAVAGSASDSRPSLSAKERALIDDAVRAARDADVAVVFAGLPEEYESENFDRESLAMPEAHSELIRAVCAANPKTVVVIQAGAPVDLAPAAGAAALLYAYLGGQGGGSAVADILTGRVNPSGKLAETFPLRIEDTPCYGDFGSESHTVEYREGVFVGYRHYKARGVPVAYPFGYGLSYTTFAYSGRAETDLGDGTKRVSVKVTNTGGRAGAEIVLFYEYNAPDSPDGAGSTDAPDSSDAADSTDAPDSSGAADSPTRGLRGFNKVFLEPGESAVVTADIACMTRPPVSTPVSYRPGGAVSTLGFHVAGLGFPASASAPAPARFDADSTLGDIKGTPAGFVFYHLVRFALTLVYGTGRVGRRMTAGIVNETPLRTIPSMSGGLLPRPVINALIALAGARPRIIQK
jgi:beta-glucosidase